VTSSRAEGSIGVIAEFEWPRISVDCAIAL